MEAADESNEGGAEGQPAGNKTKGRRCRPAVPFVVYGRVIMKSYFTTYGNYDLPPRSCRGACIRARVYAYVV